MAKIKEIENNRENILKNLKELEIDYELKRDRLLKELNELDHLVKDEFHGLAWEFCELTGVYPLLSKKLAESKTHKRRIRIVNFMLKNNYIKEDNSIIIYNLAKKIHLSRPNLMYALDGGSNSSPIGSHIIQYIGTPCRRDQVTTQSKIFLADKGNAQRYLSLMKRVVNFYDKSI